MTRGAFLFKLLAAVGLGQVANKLVIRDPGTGLCLNTNKAGADSWGKCALEQATGTLPIANAPVSAQCLKPGPGKKTWVWTRCDADCEEGEEKCPLGHCQKATRIYPLEYNAKPGSFESYQFVDTSGKLHVCSVCGTVYVPIPA